MPDSTLVIATPNPDSVAETFIRQHIRLILPGSTAVIFFEGDGNSIKDLPNLRVGIAPSNSKINSVANLIIHGYAGTVIGRQRDQIVRFLKENNASCVLAEFGQTACALKSACKTAGVALYVFFHGHDASSAGRKLKNRYSYWRMCQYASRVFVGTNYFKNTVSDVGIVREKISVAPCGVELEKFSPAETRDYNLIVAVGRMVEKKAPHLTVQAFSKTLQAIPEARLEMIGDGPLLSRAKDAAKSLGIDSKVVFHGARDHEFVKQKISKAAIFVQHSLTAPNGDTESLGVTLLEAMACEVPIVTTKHNGFVETVDDGVTGYLVNERDVDSMADRMIELMKDNRLRDNMGRSGRQRIIARYESKRQAEKLRNLLNL